MTAKQIDEMEIEELENLGNQLTTQELFDWAEWGYSGERFLEILKNRSTSK